MIDEYLKSDVHELGTHATTEQATNAMRQTFNYHGLPKRLVTDNEPQFMSQEFQMTVKANDPTSVDTTYHPPSNEQTERLIQELKKSLKSRPTGRSISHQVSNNLTAVSNDTKPANREGPG